MRAVADAPPPMARRRWRRSLAVSLAAAFSASALAASSAAAESRPPTGAVEAVAVASEQLSYEAALVDLALPRLTGAEAAVAMQVRARATSLDADPLHRQPPVGNGPVIGRPPLGQPDR